MKKPTVSLFKLMQVIGFLTLFLYMCDFSWVSVRRFTVKGFSHAIHNHISSVLENALALKSKNLRPIIFCSYLIYFFTKVSVPIIIHVLKFCGLFSAKDNMNEFKTMLHTCMYLQAEGSSSSTLQKETLCKHYKIVRNIHIAVHQYQFSDNYAFTFEFNI